MKPYPLCSYDISKDFTVGNVTKAWLNGYVYGFLVDYNTIDGSEIVNIHKYLFRKT